ncbi:DNA-3-methyladenine glycosylase family protein [Papillibacter cinnamivorans]|uniref:DNA-(apurinic or apyrimidinic site) lyase n=1 Tax=Papillibacter cinnamivorans DSM 12816 TaxID=1122930 RepID=A0A1W1ZHD7_9FIRM|nr:DNA glycosylase [Papillibacter cinnamivorans]SMC47945.1 N-glycosylase/DNA lyase [Papillibacter cinnamivorans DSM 12816]
MRVTEADGRVEITGVSDFDPEKIFECGQCFRWRRQADGSFLGVAMEKAARVRREGDKILFSGGRAEFEAVWFPYFDLERDYGSVRWEISQDPRMHAAAEYGAGIRILRQEPWEALCSFLFSQCNHIPRIRQIVETLCSTYGEPIEFENRIVYTFPKAERVAELSLGDLEVLRSGYRAPYILSAARAVTDGSLNFEALAGVSTEEARRALASLPGVGRKVADCVLLFGMGRTDAFPVDVWVRRAMERQGDRFDPSAFGENAGIAQQYIFFYERSGGAGKECAG